ncbi:Zn-dependent protease with chaperone function [Bradyrhizobium sp. LM3.4]
MAAYGLYTHIASNKFRSMLLLAGLFALVYVLVYAGALIAEVVINGNETVVYYLSRAFYDLKVAAPVATVVAAAWIVIAYFFHQSMIDAVTGGHDVTRQEQPRLYNLLENLCISRGITMPKLKIMENPALNAFATGLNPGQYSITVTTGLLNALNDKEIEAVLGHELTHIKNGDVQLMVVAVIIAGVVGFFGELFFRLFTNFGWSSGGGSWSSRLLLVIAIVLVVERQQELRRRRGGRHHHRGGADRGGMAVVASGEARAVALARISRRCGLGRADEKPGRHDLGAAQDRKPRRAAGRNLGGDGALRRQSARGLCRPVCHSPIGAVPSRRAGQVRRRPRSRPAAATRL